MIILKQVQDSIFKEFKNIEKTNKNDTPSVILKKILDELDEIVSEAGITLSLSHNETNVKILKQNISEQNHSGKGIDWEEIKKYIEFCVEESFYWGYAIS